MERIQSIAPGQLTIAHELEERLVHPHRRLEDVVPGSVRCASATRSSGPWIVDVGRGGIPDAPEKEARRPRFGRGCGPRSRGQRGQASSHARSRQRLRRAGTSGPQPAPRRNDEGRPGNPPTVAR
jgi:hypothetical protein